MEKKRIMLIFDSKQTGLAGNPKGKKAYCQQVKDKVTIGEDIEIVFPKQIIRIASSFIEGFFSEWNEKIGVDGIKNHIEIISEHQEIVERIFKVLERS